MSWRLRPSSKAVMQEAEPRKVRAAATRVIRARRRIVGLLELVVQAGFEAHGRHAEGRPQDVAVVIDALLVVADLPVVEDVVDLEVELELAGVIPGDAQERNVDLLQLRSPLQAEIPERRAVELPAGET